jgi:hypothetical protein
MMQVSKFRTRADEVGEVELLFSFPEGWNKAKGGPRAGEAVRVLGFERENCFEIAYIVSYYRGAGYAKMALRRLKACYGRLFALDVQREAQLFHEHLKKTGLLHGYDLAAPEAMAA